MRAGRIDVDCMQRLVASVRLCAPVGEEEFKRVQRNNSPRCALEAPRANPRRFSPEGVRRRAASFRESKLEVNFLLSDRKDGLLADAGGRCDMDGGRR